MGTRLRLFSGNLFNGGADPQALADLVRDNQIDVAAVQEMDHHQAEALSLVLPHGQLEPATDFTGMGIALRQPAEIDRVSLIHRNAHIARLSPREWPELDRPIEVMSVHITAPHSLPIWKQLARRRAQMRGLLDYLKASPERPRAVVGDFNASPLWPVYRRMAGVLEDLALTHANRTGQKPAPTWPATGRIARRLLRIDHCFGHAVEVLDLQVIEIPGSDHDGLLIDLSVSAA
jgi:endonuclease/exonuclease/phosphatase family metal-dependent hydrolase